MLRKKQASIPFKGYYTNWLSTLKKTLLPLLQESLSFPTSPVPLSSHLHLLLHHILSYYDSLDLAVVTDPNNLPHLLFPPWRNPIEHPFLFLGDLHPYVFTNLLRSFLDNDQENNSDQEEQHQEGGEDNRSIYFSGLERPWPVVMAWKDHHPKSLAYKIEQIECGLRLMVPALMDRVKKAQSLFVQRVGKDWVRKKKNKEKEKVEVGEAVKMEMEELVSVFVDANRLRRSVISEIVGELTIYQGALFLEGLALFLVGFQDESLLNQFCSWKTPIGEGTEVSL
ncbi:hypothetical protein Tsubulata_031205 [Turnera subulata]|uniref:DOG1 domain-containing protein n=1 Tax=Turnera subulata TaxID=218843 RepID=A0A9Q0J637_9ROSI|nr:hypothetical protein Tsubulata_031205 [Turnera subulata]